ncbi:hypothetical protein ACSBR1_029284 [Camellia fascicularis]
MSMMRSDRKPPLPRSPLHLHPRRVLRSTENTIQTPLGSLRKTQLLNRSLYTKESEIRPEYNSISVELQALTKMVQDEFENPGSINVGFGNSISATSSSVFERGRFYEEYSARRNERLKRKKGETGDEKKKKTVYDLGVKVESAKKRDVKGLRKSVLSTPMATMDRRENQRYFLRSSIKENKKPPLPVKSQKSGLRGDLKIVARRVLKS